MAAAIRAYCWLCGVRHSGLVSGTPRNEMIRANNNRPTAVVHFGFDGDGLPTAVVAVAVRCERLSITRGVSRRAMRVLLSVSLLICLLAVGCSHPSATPNRETGDLLLDNRGGFSHAGRRIVLRADGAYADTTYTDVLGDERTKYGRYTMNPERTHLMLSPEGGASQELFRVAYRDQQYWVRESERERITLPGESWLRQISVRVVP
jgi:hypothetical protein